MFSPRLASPFTLKEDRSTTHLFLSSSCPVATEIPHRALRTPIPAAMRLRPEVGTMEAKNGSHPQPQKSGRALRRRLLFHHPHLASPTHARSVAPRRPGDRASDKRSDSKYKCQVLPAG